MALPILVRAINGFCKLELRVQFHGCNSVEILLWMWTMLSHHGQWLIDSQSKVRVYYYFYVGYLK